jgi:hypothetical protein
MRIERRMEACINVYDPSRAYNGYTLFAQHASTDVWLMDMRGRLVHRWKMETPLGGDERLLPNGNMLRINKTFNEPSGHLGTVGERLLEVDWDGNIVWEHRNPTMHHDWRRLENGNTLINTHVKIPAHIASRVRGGLPESRTGGEIWGAGFQEITPDGEVVWEWIGHEHLDPEKDLFCPLCPLSIWGYINGIDVFPNGDIIASFRHLNSLMIIDRKSGDITWRWGYEHLGHQHAPQLVGNDRVLVFDNGLHRRLPGKYMDTFSMEAFSRVLEVDIGTGEIVWEYLGENVMNFFSAVCSNAERLPNGNTLICESTKGHIFEVTPDKEIVWDFVNPIFTKTERMGWTNYIFKAHRYGVEFSGFQGKRMNPDRFRYVIQEEGVEDSRGDDGEKLLSAEEVAKRRLAALGY